jgi:hypothetical protein
MFLTIGQFQKILENKVSQKISENCLYFLLLKWGIEAPGTTQGTHDATTPPGGAGQAWPCHGMVWAPWPSTYSSTCHSSLSRKNSNPLLKPVFLLFLLSIFYLLARPIFSTEIWSICSPVCDSSDCLSRILFSGVFLEYFS